MSATLLTTPASPDELLPRRVPLHPEGHHGSGVAWSAVLAGAVAAVSVGLMLITLGAGFGLAVVSPWAGRGASAAAFTAVTAGWLVVLYWISSGIGGYLTGRLRTKWAGLHTHEVFFRDTANGFVTWAVATVFGAGVVTMVAIMAVGGAAGTAGGIATAAAPTVASEAMSAGAAGYRLDTLFRGDQPAAGAADAKVQSGRILAHAVATGTMPADDRAYLTREVAAGTGLSPADAAKRVDAMMAEMNDAKVKARQVADAARKASSLAAIFTGLAMLIGAFVACVAAALGGQQRDEY
jgi:hypothetical protein